MFRESWRLVLLIIAILVVADTFLGSLKMPGGVSLQPDVHAQSLSPDSDTEESVSGISFKALSPDKRGGAWLGGSVFGVEGLLLNNKRQTTKALAIGSVEYIQDLSFTDAQSGWMIADGLLYQTKLGGKSWKEVKTIAHTSHLKSVSFVNRFVGWVASREGLIFQTNNGGSTWSVQNGASAFSIERIRFVTRNNGWAIGTDISSPVTRKILLLTKDGGRIWLKAPESDAQQFSSVMFVNSYIGWAINNKNEIVQSMDGGITWGVRRHTDGMSWVAIFFVNKLEGWAVGDGIIHTRNGGKTWEYQLRTNRSAEESLYDIIFTDSKNGWAIGLTRILRTHDSGITWTSLPDIWKARIINRVRNEKLNKKVK